MTRYALTCNCGFSTELMTGFSDSPEERNAELRSRTLAGEYGTEWKTLLSENPEAVLTTDEQVYICACGAFRQEPSLHIETAEKKRHYAHHCSLCGSRMRPWNPAEQPLNCPKCGLPMAVNVKDIF